MFLEDYLCHIDRIIDSHIREDRKRRGLGNFTWNHSLTLNISDSIEDIFENESLIDSEGFFIIKYLIFLSVLITILAYGSKYKCFFLNPAFS